MRILLLALLLALAPVGVAPPAFAQSTRVDARAEVAAALYAASATQAAELRNMDARLRQARAEIERLRAQGAGARAELISAQERYIADLAARDRAYAQEIAVFRAAVADIASTPEGVAILTQRRPGNLRQARAQLLALIDTRNAAEQRATDIRRAANLRTGATFALDDRAKGEATTAEVMALYEQVTRLDPSVHWDWIELTRLYVDAGRLSDAQQSANRALALASDLRERSVALIGLGDVLGIQGDLRGARARYEEALSIDRQIAATSALDADTRRDLSITLGRLGDVSLGLGDVGGALRYYEDMLQRDVQIARESPTWIGFLDVCSDLWGITDTLVAAGDLSRARQFIELGVGGCEQLVTDGVTGAPLQLAYARWRLANIRAAQGDVAFARDEFRSLQLFADEATRADPSNHSVALQAQLLEVSLADIDILNRNYEQARRRLNDLIAALSETSGFAGQADAYIWRAQVRLATLPGSDITWAALEPAWPSVRAAGDLSALDFLFIERARTAGKH